MTYWRPVGLLGVLLLSAAWLRHEQIEQLYLRLNHPHAPAAASTITSLKVQEASDGSWNAIVDYDLAGNSAGAVLSIRLSAGSETGSKAVILGAAPRPVIPGRHRLEVPLTRQPETVVVQEVEAALVAVVGDDVKAVATAKLAQPVRWESAEQLAVAREMSGRTSEQVGQRAAEMIDAGSITQAESLLGKLLARDPSADRAYIELARIAMKREHSAQGLQRAESLLGEALRLHPDSAKAKTVLANVYANEHRYDQAREQIEAAAASGSKDIWIWTGWGQLLEMQGNWQLALDKYSAATAMQINTAGDVLAKKQAYARQLAVMQASKDYAAMALVHQRRIAEFGEQDCFEVDYARFVLQRQSKSQGLIDQLRATSPAKCDPETVREVLGLAYFVDFGEASGEQAAALVSEAKRMRPVSAKLLYELALSERGAKTLQRLVREGELVDQKDAHNNNALTYAMDGSDLEAAQRLIKLGARPVAPIGPNDVPVALVPVFNHDPAGILLMRRSGVDYASLRYRGRTAVQHARDVGDTQLAQMLGSR